MSPSPPKSPMSLCSSHPGDLPPRETLLKSPAILNLEDEIARLANELSQLQAQHASLIASLGIDEPVISPVQQLPVEILNAIFLHCLPTTHDALITKTQAPLLLTQICQEWRRAAIGLQALWSSIYIPIPPYPLIEMCLSSLHGPHKIPLPDDTSSYRRAKVTQEQEDFIEDVQVMWDKKIHNRFMIVREWLRRAGDSSLSISLVQWHSITSGNGRMAASFNRWPLTNLIDHLKHSAGRWKRLDVVAEKSVVHRLVSLDPTATPRLEVLRVAARELSAHPNAPLAGVALFNAQSLIVSPRLRTLTARLLQDDILELPVRWEKLTSLHFHGYTTRTRPLSLTPMQALVLLSKCKNLVTCGLVLGASNLMLLRQPPAHPDPLEPRRVVLPNLKKLWIHEPGHYPLNQFFESLEVPNLTSLAFSTMVLPTVPKDESAPEGHTASSPAPPQRPSSLVAFLRIWGHNIKTLMFDYIHQTPDELQECFRLVPHVEHLSLTTDSRHSQSINLGAEFVPVESALGVPAVVSLSHMGNKVMRGFIPDPTRTDHGCWCPKLRTFSVRLSTVEFSEETLLEFVETRRSLKAKEMGITPLEVTRVAFATDIRRMGWTSDLSLDGDPTWIYGAPQASLRSSIDWPAFDRLKGRSDVDLTGFKMEVQWPSITSWKEKNLKLAGSGPSLAPLVGSWSPFLGLEDVTMDSSDWNAKHPEDWWGEC